MIVDSYKTPHYVRVRLAEGDRYCEWRSVMAGNLRDAVNIAADAEDVLCVLEATLFIPHGYDHLTGDLHAMGGLGPEE